MRGTMKTKRLSSIAIAAALFLAVVLSIASALPLRAETTATVAQSITLNAGESHVIDHLMKDAKPRIRILENPNALIVHDEIPGQLVLLGAARGKWQITVTLEDGVQVAYLVSIAAISPGSSSLDAGTGPVASAPTSSSKSAPVAHWTAPPIHQVEAYSTDDVPMPEKPSAPQIAQQQIPFDGGIAPTSPENYSNDPLVPTDGPAASTGRHYLPDGVISVMSGNSQVIDFHRRLKRISIADSSVADIQVTTPYQLNLIGHKTGFTTLAIWDDQGHYVERAVRIDTGGAQQVMLNAMVAELDRTKIETQGVDLSVALTKAGISLTSLPGSVATPYGPSVQLPNVSSPGVAPAGGDLLPLLLSTTMTYGLSTSNANLATETLFQFLESHNLGRILAQPHLLANSGQSASFLSGGEIPIVLAQALNTSIVFKEFGTKVDCRPTVIGRRDIELLVKTEVSEPDYAHGVALFGFTVPAFVTRKADTLVRLKDGQTLVIAGLILRNRNEVVNKVPYLGDLPYAGALFRNTNWEDQQTDLVMSVRPEIVGALPPNGQVFLPSERGPLTTDEIRTQKLDMPDAARPRF